MTTNDAWPVVAAAVFAGSDLDKFSEDELVDAAAVAYERDEPMISLRIGFELGVRGFVPTKEQHRRLGFSEFVKTREEPGE